MIKQALLLHQKGRLAEAASLYRKILAQNPEHADALHLLGVIELQKKNASAGLELINRAITIDPNNAAFFCNRGVALQELKRFHEAHYGPAHLTLIVVGDLDVRRLRADVETGCTPNE